MKIRSDFVSNSSSCSFVIAKDTDTLVSGLEFFSKTFSDTYIPSGVSESISISLSVKNKWFKEVYEAVHNEKCESWSDYYSNWTTGKSEKKDPEDLDWCGISLTLGALVEIGQRRDLINKIDRVRFSCEDTGIMYLRLLYMFFERNVFCPNAQDSESNFLSDDGDSDFIKILSVT